MKLYISSITDFSDLPGLDLITVKRRYNLEKFNNIEDKQRCLVAGLMLRYAFGEGVNDIVASSNSKPYHPGGPYFNLSHSGDYAVLALSEHELGVDIERHGQYKDKLARRCCTDEEYNWLKTQNPDAFYKLWTGKESIMKATGLGFALPAGSFSVLPVSDGPHSINGQSWYMRWLDILPGYALCTSSAVDENIEPIWLTGKELLE